MNAVVKPVPTARLKRIRVSEASPTFWRVTFDDPPLNLIGPEFIREFDRVMTAIEGDAQVRVVVFDSAIEGFFLSRSHLTAELEDVIAPLTAGWDAWCDIVARISRAPVISIAKLRGSATGNGSEIALACDMCFASQEKALLPRWELGVGAAGDGEYLARLPRLLGAARALELLMSSDTVRRELAAVYGYINRSLPDVELDAYVDALARRISSFDRLAICNAKRLVNAASLPRDAWRH